MILFIQIIVGIWVARALPLCLRVSMFLICKWIIEKRYFNKYYFILSCEGYGNYPVKDGLVRYVKPRHESDAKYKNEPFAKCFLGPWWFLTPEDFKKQIMVW